MVCQPSRFFKERFNRDSIAETIPRVFRNPADQDAEPTGAAREVLETQALVVSTGTLLPHAALALFVSVTNFSLHASRRPIERAFATLCGYSHPLGGLVRAHRARPEERGRHRLVGGQFDREESAAALLRGDAAEWDERAERAGVGYYPKCAGVEGSFDAGECGAGLCVGDLFDVGDCVRPELGALATEENLRDTGGERCGRLRRGD
eukprot:ctg_433.g253